VYSKIICARIFFVEVKYSDVYFNSTCITYILNSLVSCIYECVYESIADLCFGASHFTAVKHSLGLYFYMYLKSSLCYNILCIYSYIYIAVCAESLL